MIAAKASVFSKNAVRSTAKNAGVASSHVSYAKTVLEFAPDLVDAVMAGAKTLNDAYQVARQRKQESSGDGAKLDLVRAEDPNLASRVTDEELTLSAALEEVRQRQAKRRQISEEGQRAAQSLVTDTRANIIAVVTSRQQPARRARQVHSAPGHCRNGFRPGTLSQQLFP